MSRSRRVEHDSVYFVSRAPTSRLFTYTPGIRPDLVLPRFSKTRAERPKSALAPGSGAHFLKKNNVEAIASNRGNDAFESATESQGIAGVGKKLDVPRGDTDSTRSMRSISK